MKNKRAIFASALFSVLAHLTVGGFFLFASFEVHTTSFSPQFIAVMKLATSFVIGAAGLFMICGAIEEAIRIIWIKIIRPPLQVRLKKKKVFGWE